MFVRDGDADVYAVPCASTKTTQKQSTHPEVEVVPSPPCLPPLQEFGWVGGDAVKHATHFVKLQN